MEVDNFLRFGNGGVVHEAGIVRTGRNEILNKAIREVESAGGQVRSVQTLVSFHLIPRLSGESYFRVTSDGIPVLGIERGSSNATIAHELAHFKDWLNFRTEFIAQGFDAKTAAIKARSKLLKSGPQMTRFTEENAVAAERALNKSDFRDSDFIRRSIYPEVAAFVRAKSGRRAITSRKNAELNALLDSAIAKAIALRRLRANAFREDLLKQGLSPRQIHAIQTQIDEANDLGTLTVELFPEDVTISGDLGVREIFQQRLKNFMHAE